MKSTLCLLLLLTTVVAVPAHAKSWLRSACEVLLGPKTLVIPENLEEISNLFNTQIEHSNRFSSHRLRKNIAEIPWLKDNPVSLLIKPELNSAYEWVGEKPMFEAFVNPEKFHLNWEDSADDLALSHGLLMLIEDVEVDTAKGSRRISDIVAEEVEWMRRRNPTLQFKLVWTPVSEYSELLILPKHQDKFVVWVEGRIENFQAKRISLVILEEILQTLTRDPKFIVSKSKN